MKFVRILTMGLVTIAVSCILSFPQTIEEETAGLLEHLGLPNTVAVAAATVPGIPAKEPLKVYLAFGMDMRVRDNFVGWISKWNKKDAKKHGQIVVVTRLEEADMIFVRYARRDEKSRYLETKTKAVPTYGRTTRDSTVTGSINSNSSSVYEGSTSSGTSHSSLSGSRHATTTTTGTTMVSEQNIVEKVPLFAYVIRRTKSGLEILWRYVSDIPIDYIETNRSGEQLFDDFKKLAKDRPRI